MNKDLIYYVKNNKSFLSRDLCNKTIKELNLLDSSVWKDHTFYNSFDNTSTKLSGEQELSVVYTNQITTKKIIMDNLWNAIDNYIRELNFSWFDGWTGYTDIRFNRYTLNKKMAEHCDHIHSMFDGQRKGVPILSVLGILNDNYSGGEFIMFKDVEIKLEQGDVLIFPSNFLYPHKVEPVTKGVRHSFISWVY